MLTFVAMAWCVATPCAAQPCIPDQNLDSHPLFRSLDRRVDVAYIDGIGASASPIDMAFGDLDADGDLDGAFACSAMGEYLTILLNRGDAVFDPPTVYAAGKKPVAVALGDVDGDADLDVAVVNGDDDTVSVFLNQGDGTLGPQSVLPVGAEPSSVVAADFNADALADLAVLNTVSKDVSIYISVGDGSFAPEVRVNVGVVTPKFPVSGHPGPFMIAADLDTDSDQDLVVPAGDKLAILHNDGRGNFTLDPVKIPMGIPEYLNDIAAADFNADGSMDLAAVGKDDPAGTEKVLSVVFQSVDGLWLSPTVYAGPEEELGLWHRSIDVGDVDNDDDIDIVLGQYAESGVPVFLNDSAGAFKPELHLTKRGPWNVALEDLNGDGWLDLAFIDGIISGRALRIHLNDGAGDFVGPAAKLDSSDLGLYCDSHLAAAAADLDLDGDLDVVGGLSATSCATQVNLYENDGEAAFSVAGEISLVPVDGGAIVTDLGIADLNGDGWPDIVVVDDGQWDLKIDYPGSVWVLLNQAGLDFAPPLELPLETNPFRAALADFNGDGHIDVAVTTRSVQPTNPVLRTVEILLNDGRGVLREAQSVLLENEYGAGGVQGVIASADLDADGDVDLVTSACSSDTLCRFMILTNDGAGTFTITRDEPAGSNIFAIVLEDLDADADTDMALMLDHPAPSEADFPSYLRIYHNDGDGMLFLAEEHFDANVDPKWEMSTTDFNLDGYPDLALNMSSAGVLIQLNNRDGTFAKGVGYDLLGYSVAQVVGDFDADGRNDIVSTSLVEDDILTLLQNASCPPCPADINNDTTLNILDFIAFQQAWLAKEPAADCDHDDAYTLTDFTCYHQQFLRGCN